MTGGRPCIKVRPVFTTLDAVTAEFGHRVPYRIVIDVGSFSLVKSAACPVGPRGVCRHSESDVRAPASTQTNSRMDAEYLARPGRVDTSLFHAIRHRGAQAHLTIAPIEFSVCSGPYSSSLHSGNSVVNCNGCCCCSCRCCGTPPHNNATTRNKTVAVQHAASATMLACRHSSPSTTSPSARPQASKVAGSPKCATSTTSHSTSTNRNSLLSAATSNANGTHSCASLPATHA